MTVTRCAVKKELLGLVVTTTRGDRKSYEGWIFRDYQNRYIREKWSHLYIKRYGKEIGEAEALALLAALPGGK